VVALTPAVDAAGLAARAADDYHRQTGLTPTSYVCRASAGAGPLE
jgi:galactokinase